MSLLPERNLTLTDFTKHAGTRLKERDISPDAVALAIQHGKKHYCRGAVVYVMRQRDVQRHADKPGVNQRLTGIHVVCSQAGSVITCYRSFRYRAKQFAKSRIRNHRRRFA